MAPKKIPRSRVIQHFLTLPEEQRIRLLRENLSSEAVQAEAANQFYGPMIKLREQPEMEAKAFLKKHFGDSPEHLKKTIAHGEVLLGEHRDSEYTEFHARTDEEKLYAQVCCKSLVNRLRIYYDDLNPRDKETYKREALAAMSSKKGVTYLLEDPGSFAAGKSPEGFLDDVTKTMDLSKEKSIMEHLRTIAPAGDPERREKLLCAAQQYMIFDEGRLDPEDLAKKFQGKDWKKSFNTRKTLKKEDSGSRIPADKLLRRIKSAMNDIPETEEEKAIFREAALQTCRDFKAHKQFTEKTTNPNEKEFLKFTKELQDEIAAEGLKKEDVQELRGSLAGEYRTLEKEKSGWFLSKTNSPEYDRMMKGLRLLNAKLDLLAGKQPEGLTEEELKTVRESDVGTLHASAKAECYNYGCLKTGNGTKSIWHDAGTDRFDASMNTLSQLNELGKKLHLTDPAAALRDDVQLQLLKNRRDKAWMKQNIEDLTAKAICAQVLMNGGTPGDQQRSALEGDAFKAQLDKIKADDSFKQMMKTVDQDKIADAIIKGGTGLAEVFQKSVNASKQAGSPQGAPELDPKDLTPAKDAPGLSSPVR